MQEYYKLSITKQIENPDYEAEMERHKEDARYNNYNTRPTPEKMIPGTVLQVELTPSQWEAVKFAVLETFK